MDIKEAIDLINSITYRPGVKISAGRGSWSDVRVSLNWATKDTGREFGKAARNVDGRWTYENGKSYAELGYPKNFTMMVDFGIDGVASKSEEEILAYVLRSVIALEIHEAREFFRVGAKDYEAPFHPHVPSGTVAWRKASETDNNYQKWGDSSRYAGETPTFTKTVPSKASELGEAA